MNDLVEVFFNLGFRDYMGNTRRRILSVPSIVVGDNAGSQEAPFPRPLHKEKNLSIELE